MANVKCQKCYGIGHLITCKNAWYHPDKDTWACESTCKVCFGSTWMENWLRYVTREMRDERGGSTTCYICNGKGGWDV